MIPSITADDPGTDDHQRPPLAEAPGICGSKRARAASDITRERDRRQRVPCPSTRLGTRASSLEQGVVGVADLRLPLGPFLKGERQWRAGCEKRVLGVGTADEVEPALAPQTSGVDV